MQKKDRSRLTCTVSFRLTEQERQLLAARAAAMNASSPQALARELVVRALTEPAPVPGPIATPPSLAVIEAQIEELRRSLRKSFSTLLTNLREDVTLEVAKELFGKYYKGVE